MLVVGSIRRFVDQRDDSDSEGTNRSKKEHRSQEVCRELADLPSGTLLYENGLARILGKKTRSIRRAVERGELPMPTRLMGRRVWTVGALVRHMEKRMDLAGKAGQKILRYASGQ